MHWNDFITHSEVRGTYNQESPGKYLFLKTLHEIIAGLNGYKGWVLSQTHISFGNNVLDNTQNLFTQWDTVVKVWSQVSQENTANDVQIWVSHWNPIIDQWLIKLMFLKQQYESDVTDNVDWASLINELTTIPDKISLQNEEAQILTIPNDEQEKIFVVGLKSCIAKVSKICVYIREKEYIKLWKFPHEEI